MSFTQTLSDWKKLKREMYGVQPRQRNNDTFKHQDIFGSKLTADLSNLNNPTDQSKIGKYEKKTPKRVRENDTSKSHMFDKQEVAKENSPKGKRTFPHQKSLNDSTIERKHRLDDHKIKDHPVEFFYDMNDDDQKRSLKAKAKTELRETSKDSINPKQRRQDDLYKTEIKIYNCLGDGNETKQNPIQNVQDNQQQQTLDIDRSYNNKLNSKEMRINHNLSNIFQRNEYGDLRYSSVRQSKDCVQPKKELIKIDELNLKEINEIKKKNHNFSDVFGLEYGVRGYQPRKKSLEKQLSSISDWKFLDSTKIAKHSIEYDYSKDYSPLQKRSKVMDQKSSLDTHNLYLQEISPPPSKLQTQRNTITRTLRKISKW